MTSKIPFKETFTFEQRKDESAMVIAKYQKDTSSRIPVIVSKNSSSKNTPPLDKHKFLVPDSLSLAQFSYIIRKRINLTPADAIYIYVCDNDKITLPPMSNSIGTIYNDSKDKDGFLYLIYSCEETFGN